MNVITNIHFSIFSCVILGIFTLLLLINKYKCKFDIVLLFLLYGSFVLFAFQCMDWYSINYYLRYILIAGFVVIMIFLIKKSKGLPAFRKKNIIAWAITGVFLALLTIGIYINCMNISAHCYSEEPIKLSFPFKNGMYTTFNGGNGEKSPFLNYHMNVKIFKDQNYSNGMKYAVDIVKINGYGFSSVGILPKSLNKYEIFGEPIYSPCDGTVFSVVSNIADIDPLSEPIDTGNQIIIKKGDIYIYMTHIQKDSITVETGDEIKEGQLIAKAGNSGLTPFPHLHIQAAKNNWLYGEGVPILFDNKFVIKNELIIKK